MPPEVTLIHLIHLSCAEILSMEVFLLCFSNDEFGCDGLSPIGLKHRISEPLGRKEGRTAFTDAA